LGFSISSACVEVKALRELGMRALFSSMHIYFIELKGAQICLESLGRYVWTHTCVRQSHEL
jgi:hypothetical protein